MIREGEMVTCLWHIQGLLYGWANVWEGSSDELVNKNCYSHRSDGIERFVKRKTAATAAVKGVIMQNESILRQRINAASGSLGSQPVYSAS